MTWQSRLTFFVSLSILSCSSMPASADLVSLWRFEADASPQPDSSQYGHEADLVDDVQWVNDGERGGVMEFDGDADYLEVEDTDELSIEGDLTIAAWANFVSFDGYNSIVSKTDDGLINHPSPYDLYTVNASDGKLRFYVGADGVSGQFTSFDPPELEEWQHIAVTLNEDGDVVHYLNGENNGDGFIAQEHFDSDTNLYIGSRADFVTNMLGRLDDVAIFDEVLSEEQVQTIMGGDFSAFLGDTPDGDFNQDGMLNAPDIDLLSTEIKNVTNDAAFDLNGDTLVDLQDHQMWVADLKGTWLGDSNLDGEFNSSDFVQVFTRGKYEDGVAMNSGWEDGDWNADLDFDSSDFVAAFTDGGYELGPRPAMNAAAVPEPTSSAMLLLAGLASIWLVRGKRIAVSS